MSQDMAESIVEQLCVVNQQCTPFPVLYGSPSETPVLATWDIRSKNERS